MRLVEEEDELGLVEVAYFGKLLEEVGEHPQEEHRVDLRLLDDARSVQDVDVALAARVAGEPIGQFKRGLAEEHVAALILNGDERAQDGAHGLRRDVAIGRRVLLGVLAHVVEHRAEVFHVDEEHLPVVGDAEDDVQHAFLHLGEPEQTREQHWPHVRDGHANGDAVLAVHVPKTGGATLVSESFEAELGDALLHVLGVDARLAHAGDVAFDVGHEDGHARLREAFRHHLERDRLARARSASDKAVTICLVKEQIAGVFALRHPNLVVLKHGSSLRSAEIGPLYRGSAIGREARGGRRTQAPKDAHG